MLYGVAETTIVIIISLYISYYILFLDNNIVDI